MFKRKKIFLCFAVLTAGKKVICNSHATWLKTQKRLRLHKNYTFKNRICCHCLTSTLFFFSITVKIGQDCKRKRRRNNKKLIFLSIFWAPNGGMEQKLFIIYSSFALYDKMIRLWSDLEDIKKIDYSVGSSFNFLIGAT